MNLRLDLTLIDNTETGSRLALSLSNLSDVPLNDWQLEFSYARRINVRSLSQGDLEQIGSFCRLTPPSTSRSLAPNQHFYTEFEVNLPHLTLMIYGIPSAVIRSGETLYPVQVTPLSLGPDAHCRGAGSSLNGRETAAISIIPQPAALQVLQGTFTLDTHCVIRGDQATSPAARWLQEEIEQQCNIQISTGTTSGAGNIHVEQRSKLASGSYELLVEPEAIWIQASDKAGFFAAVASLLQLIPLTANEGGAFTLPCLQISDAPRLGYRGMMLDCARHFHSLEQVKQVIGQLARLKFNTFHWHLTDDEGWRIEIKALPALTEIGAWRGPNEVLQAQYSQFESRHGGYYTQDEIREVIAYASARGITVIPEIDIPGHCRAAIKSLPDMLVDPDDHSKYVSIQNYTDNILNPALAGTYTFIETVLEEVCALFPAPYVHIGADEVPKGVWTDSQACAELMAQHGYQDPMELQGHLLRHTENFLSQRGKRMLGWEEAVHGDKVSKQTVIYSWLSEEAGLKCIEQGYDVVMQPAQSLYLDLVQGDYVDEAGVDWAGQLPIEKVYDYDPLGKVPQDLLHKVLGIQTALWSETVATPEQINYLLYPRLFAVAEVAWSEERDWGHFALRLNQHLNYLDKMGIQYRHLDNNQ
ncbi:beta-N-acetylhexosaminidase [Thaumasiovibrio subtropicus]|uniref:beta-N-acetylhexosaminidase n=1 Tax=Thaumasiovibrio subtropicus TaxID=1891207 RepID=UPI000B35E8DE|nr:beta-N-acetylhexosaminidase [Thaumasiovibrio subtropicus]